MRNAMVYTLPNVNERRFLEVNGKRNGSEDGEEQAKQKVARTDNK